jgi:hypothetical protein
MISDEVFKVKYPGSIEEEIPAGCVVCGGGKIVCMVEEMVLEEVIEDDDEVKEEVEEEQEEDDELVFVNWEVSNLKLPEGVIGELNFDVTFDKSDCDRLKPVVERVNE